MAHGDRRNFITALISLDPEAIREWAAENDLGHAGIEELARHPAVQALIQREVEARNRELASFETVKKFHILPRELSIEEGELTPTLKIKRKVVVEHFGSELEALYAG
jgi:long-chain acyl-CoA synthetase